MDYFYAAAAPRSRGALWPSFALARIVLKERLYLAVGEHMQDIQDVYANYSSQYSKLEFLGLRDREMWKPLFAICEVFAPDRIEELKACGAGITAYKTTKPMRFGNLAEKEAQADDRDAGESQ